MMKCAQLLVYTHFGRQGLPIMDKGTIVDVSLFNIG
jgi:hypothetical protein